MTAGRRPNIAIDGRGRAVVHRIAAVLLVILATVLGVNTASYAETADTPVVAAAFTCEVLNPARPADALEAMRGLPTLHSRYTPSADGYSLRAVLEPTRDGVWGDGYTYDPYAASAHFASAARTTQGRGTHAKEAPAAVYLVGVAANAVTRSLDDVVSLRGATTAEVEGLIPSGWVKSATSANKSGLGIRYSNPERLGEQIRIMPGKVTDPNPLKQGPYMRISRNGTVTDPIPLFGSPTL